MLQHKSSASVGRSIGGGGRANSQAPDGHVLAGILKDRTVVLVTHNKTSLSFCDRIYLMEQGKLREVGQDSELEIPLVSDAEESHDDADEIRY